jgi:hypothetical protein
MSEIQISSTELVRSIGDILGRLRFRGDSFIVEKNGKPIAILSPYPGHARKTLKDILGAWIDAGERDEELADLLDEVSRNDAPPEDPWGSR